jgi:iron complex transport system ATP-binding protein
MLSVKEIRYHVGKKEILNGISTNFSSGVFHVIVGPNGSGKSTFLKIFSGELKPQEGEVLYEGQNVFHIDKTAMARQRAVMSQQPELYFPLTVAEIVMMGRYPHFTYRPTKKDENICMQAMQKMEVDELISRDYLTLSGGEKQRVQFARVLSQIWEAVKGEKKFLFLDEAVSHLDLKHQHQLLQIARQLSGLQSTVIVILHDINLAITYADRILFMKQGRIVYDIAKDQEVTTEIIRDVFDVNAKIFNPGNGHKPVVVF